MKYRPLGNTGLMVSEIGLGGEWLQRHTAQECYDIIKRCEEYGVNILDCFMSEPNVRTNIGAGIRDTRDQWIIQGHIGSAWRDGQYVRTRDVPESRAAFEDLLARLGTDHIELGMIHFVDRMDDWDKVLHTEFLDYVFELRKTGKVEHLGISTHNPAIARLAAETGWIEVILFSLNPAYDLLPATEEILDYFVDEYDAALEGMDPERAELYKICEQRGVGLTVMKCYAGGRLFDEKRSPFGVRMTPVQCIHYALTRPAVAAVMVGYDTTEHVDAAVAYETASDSEKDYASVLAGAPRHAYFGQCTYCGHCQPCPGKIDIAMVNKLYDLASMQPEVPASVREHYEGLEVRADACIGCGACEKRCPFGVKVAERMKKTKALFG